MRFTDAVFSIAHDFSKKSNDVVFPFHCDLARYSVAYCRDQKVLMTSFILQLAFRFSDGVIKVTIASITRRSHYDVIPAVILKNRIAIDGNAITSWLMSVQRLLS